MKKNRILHIKPSYYTFGWEFGFWITSGADMDGKHCYGLNIAFFSGQIHIGLREKAGKVNDERG